VDWTIATFFPGALSSIAWQPTPSRQLNYSL